MRQYVFVVAVTKRNVILQYLVLRTTYGSVAHSMTEYNAQLYERLAHTTRVVRSPMELYLARKLLPTDCRQELW